MDFKYKANVINVYDGDTCRVDVELGFGVVLKNQAIRFYGINAIELRDENGKKARDYLKSLILNKDIILETHKDKKGKYGRWLGTLYIDGLNVNEDMVNKKYAIFKEY